MTATLPDVETIEHLAFEPSCQAPNCEAGHPAATHIGRVLPCGCAVPICTPCVDAIITAGEQPVVHGACRLCNGPLNAPRLLDIVRIEPLR